MDFRTITALNAICQRSIGRGLDDTAPRKFRYEELLPIAYSTAELVGATRDTYLSLEDDADVCRAVSKHCASGSFEALTTLPEGQLALAREYVATLVMLYLIGAEHDPNGGIVLPDLQNERGLISAMLAREILHNRTPQRWLSEHSSKVRH